MTEKPFWQTVKLADMTAAQWEALCDGCAKCCFATSLQCGPGSAAVRLVVSGQLSAKNNRDSGQCNWIVTTSSLFCHFIVT